MAAANGEPTPEGIFSLLDTDLYKLTMQCAVLKFFPKVTVAYNFTNRTPHMKLTRAAFNWLQRQIERLGNIAITEEELSWLKKQCPYFSEDYLSYLASSRLKPSEQVQLDFDPTGEGSGDEEQGDIRLQVKGLWLETILYEIPLLALTSEAYFKFVDTDWTHRGQVDGAKEKGRRLLQAGCIFSEFGSRRRRDYQTHSMVLQGLCEATQEAQALGHAGKFTGTSNVHLAMKHGVAPVGTVAHEWFMGMAAVADSHARANELALRHWVGTFGRGVLGIALTDTFGTPAFLDAFQRTTPREQPTDKDIDTDTDADPPLTYAQIFTGTRQDSGDPLDFLKVMRRFYDAQGIRDKKTIVYSDSLDVDKCVRYKAATDAAGLTPSFGIGTFFTNDFVRAGDGATKSVPLNIVIKLAEAEGRKTVKLSDNAGKNTGDMELVRRVKEEVGYREKLWEEGDEAHRWDQPK